MKNRKMSDLIEDKPSAESRDRISNLKLFLEENNSDYKKIVEKISKIKKQSPIIELLYDGQIIDITKDDCELLQEVISLQYKKLAIEEGAIENLGIARTLKKLSMLEAFEKYLEEK